MALDVLNAILNIADYRMFDLNAYASASRHIRLKNTGEQIDHYVKDAFTGSYRKIRTDKKKAYPGFFSYEAGKGRLPSFVLENGPAVIIRKIESPTGKISLGHFFPMRTLKQESPFLDEKCRKAEGGSWMEKDLYYAVVFHEKKDLRYMYVVQGKCFLSDVDDYAFVYTTLWERLNELAKTAKLKKAKSKDFLYIKALDQMGNAQLKLKARFTLKNPEKIFAKQYKPNLKVGFTLVSVIEKETFMKLPSEERKKIEAHKNLTVVPLELKNPEDKSRLIPAVMIIGRWGEEGH